ncbi:phosphoribosylanthranilate isomerase [Lutibacter sp. TH_r2]|uniref:phosphoribosylanthranilate isomerase n=1 Tax=Lutibacter sp. TH_r2 TaxID=3082083 RepID=UPI00295445F9|nr:phosphoribosylanthranilate isomerase [Lutibacter sp. TH_r2]MDV7185810.1 phosphoribosylanthranilate isomerase [Lutibacter sp. TH_r2]
MKIKVCGMRDAENISELVKLKPDYMGFIFYGKSKRFVSDFPQVEIPSEIKKVGVFVNESFDEVIEIVEKNKLDAIQLHGNESPDYCEELKVLMIRPVEIFKAFSVDDNFDFSKTLAYQKCCDYLLFDTKGKEYGGNGVKFNWQVLDNYKGETPFLLSGGIAKVDAAEIKNISHKAFAGIDINSGFEIEPALKNIKDIKEFKQNL